MLTGSCHCGDVRIEIPRVPAQVTRCNCSICRRYGTFWGYYPRREIGVRAAPAATASYVWGDRVLAFVRCTRCGCVTYWDNLVDTGPEARMGVNLRMFDLEAWSGVPVHDHDGAAA